MTKQRPDAVLVTGEGDLYANRALIAELAEKHRFATMSRTAITSMPAD